MELSLAEAKERLGQIDEVIQELDQRFKGKKFDDEASVRWRDLQVERSELLKDVEEVGQRQRYIEELARDPSTHIEPGWDEGHPERNRRDKADLSRPGWVERDKALRTIERYQATQPSDAADRADRLVRDGDPLGVGAKYIAAVGDPSYATAFAKMVKDPTTGHLRFSEQEVEAVRAATSSVFERALITTTTGVPVPYQLDPSLMISGTGAINPLRQIARVELITAGTWKGATSAEVTAAYQAEAAEVADATPAMTQPSITSQRGAAFIPFSIEVDQDWDTAVADLGRLLADGRDVLDSTKMLTGTGTNEPGGLLNIGGTGGLTTTQRALSAGAGAVAIADVYALKQALPARFLANASFTFHPTRLDGVYRLVAAGSTTEPQIFSAGRGGPLLGKPVYEWSSMATAVTTGSKWGIIGDFTNFLIADRLGFSVELIPHLFGAANRFPTGQRGLVSFWRTGTGVLVANAFRYGETS